MVTNFFPMSLEEIAKKHGTLKVQHGYMPIYEKFFGSMRCNPIMNLLEIGVHEGASLRTWADYFLAGSSILGVDMFLTDKAIAGAGRDSYSLMGCDGSRDFHMILGKWDVIIDDGSHIGTEQLASFNGLWDSLKPGGYYIVEDLFAAYDPVWNHSPVFIDHIQSRLKNILIGGDDIQEIHWYGRNDINGILFLRKRYEAFRIQPLTEFQ